MKTKTKKTNETNETNDDFDYTYKMEEGISTVKGGAKVIQSTFNDAPKGASKGGAKQGA
jgi:hypothetical protein